MITVEPQPLKTVETSLARLLRCTPQMLAIACSIVSEHIRASLYGALTFGNVQTVHTTRLLSNARRALSLTWPQHQHHAKASEKSTEPCRDVLDRMEQLGDAWDSGHGRWIATPLRCVFAEGSDRCLVLGSAPHSLAERRLKTTISCAGPSRFADAAQLRDQILIQSVDTWLGSAPPLAAWTTEILETSASRMQNVGGLPAEQLEIYAPDVQQRGTSRWIEAGDVRRDLPEIRLCRPTLRYAQRYNRPYYLARFALMGGFLVLQGQTPIPYGLSLRLRMGLDMRLGRPRQLAIVVSEDTFSIDRPLTLPDPERRVFALGWPDPSSDGSTERLTFHHDALAIVLQGLKRLSVRPALVRKRLP